jgi:hypothetical protein
MSNAAIPDNVARLLETAIASVADLEVLLYLRRKPEASWDPNAVADLLFLDRPLSAAILKRLHGHGLLTAESGQHVLYRYSPTAETGAIIDQIAGLYAERPVMVIAALARRYPQDGLRFFSDAFRFRKSG